MRLSGADHAVTEKHIRRNSVAIDVCAMYSPAIMKMSSDCSLGCRTDRGFALIASLATMLLLALVAVAFLSLASVQMKVSRVDRFQAEAEANAQLALMLAIGELQRELGPDQRISATAKILEKDGEKLDQAHWTGVWSATDVDGDGFYTRDDLQGGLKDRRFSSEGARNEQGATIYLVSGNEGGLRFRQELRHTPDAVSRSETIQLVGAGSAGESPEAHVLAPVVPIIDSSAAGKVRGRYAFWVGDLGVRANVASSDPHRDGGAIRKNLPLLGGGPTDPRGIEVAGVKLTFQGDEREKLTSQRSVDLLSEDAGKWRKASFHDITVLSEGVQANVRDGGLKKNLTAFLNKSEDIPDLAVQGGDDLRGLASSDNLVGPANEVHARELGLNWEETRHRETSPTFGLLRDWAQLGQEVPFAGSRLDARVPKSEPNFQIPDVLENSSQNLNPAALTNVERTNLVPIMVEGSMYNTFSTHRNPVGSRFPYNIRSHDFPRVVLWNPYSVPLTLPRSVAVLQVNGRRGFRTDAWRQTEDGQEYSVGFATWLSFGGRTRPDGPVVGSAAYEDAYTGSYYFTLEEATFAPGECLVFLPNQAAEYDGENIFNNTLTVSAEYDFQNNYYHSSSEFDEENPGEVGGMTWYPKRFWYTPSDAFFGGSGQLTQSDDSQMFLKKAGSRSEASPEDVDQMEQIAAISCSLQFGAGREPPEAWDHEPGNPNSGVPIEFLAMVNPVVTLPPDVRTRQGYRMRWFDEHPSNTSIGNNGLAAFPEAWEEAFIANWNLRAAYSSRSPYENLIGNRGDNRSSGPWFFGIYTKDLYDEAVGWLDQTPVRGSDNRNRGNPFGEPSQAADSYVLFDVPRKELGVISLAQFQHAKISEFIWHPSYAVANSLIDPRLGREGQTGTSPVGGGGEEKNGFVSDFIGWSDNAERGLNQEAWAEHGRGIFHDSPETENVVYDLSFEVNHTLWDEYFLTSGSTYDLRQAALNPSSNPLPNPRMKPRSGASYRDLGDFHRAASVLMTEGAFNVNSTSVEAWQAVLSANRREDGTTVFPRIIGGERDEWNAASALDKRKMWDQTRALSDEEIESLAEAIVDEVRARGPFLSLAEFVNRRLITGPEYSQEDEQGKRGALEAAILNAGLNTPVETAALFRLTNDRSLGDYNHPDNISDSTLIAQDLKPDSKAWGAPVHLTQADVLQAIGSSLSARSDTFVIRAYGESVSNGKVVARAWCEAVVQRVPDPVRPDSTGLNPKKESEFPDFGRRFITKSFRWLDPSEI